MNQPLAERLIAHRGYRGRYPENTRSSILAAIDAGAKHIEFDVQMNAERDLVVIHDDDFLRTTHQAGSVFQATTAETRALSAHEPDRFAQTFYPQPIMLLSDVLELCRPYSDIQLFIDVRRESLDYWGQSDVLQPLFTAVNSYPNPLFVISFDPEAIAYCQQNSDLHCGWILKKYNTEHFAIADALNPHMLVCNHAKIPDEGPLHQGDWLWMLYGIETTEQVIQLHSRGIDLFETDHIDELVSGLR